MLIYGDHHERIDPNVRISEINRELGALESKPPGADRHARLVSVLVEAGKLLQGMADSDFERRGLDCPTPMTDQLCKSLLRLGRAVCRSWDSHLQEIGDLPRLPVSHGEWPAEVEVSLPEGFAFYAVYPEAYIEAARRLRLTGEPRVIGIRSIGTSLSAVVAAALGAPAPVTVRPFGDPSARTIAVDRALERELLSSHAHYVIVDEGPGQSGSSFGSVADWLEERGVPADRIAILPSHAAPPGAQSTAARRQWWSEAQREVGDFGEHWPTLIARLSGELLGRLEEEPRDISAGRWREIHYPREDEWPSIVPAWERRKSLLRARGERFLVKFAGIGRIGEEKLTIARALGSEGLIPQPLGLVHGFLVERWCEGASPVTRDDKPLREIARYIGTRARLLPAASGSGASIDELAIMARRNISLELGEHRARTIERWASRARELERRIVRVRTDNKLDRHEWLRARSGALIKTDALDHHRAHDLIGCQDVAWDVAGAIVEFDVGQVEAQRLLAEVEHWAGRAVDRALLGFYTIAYLAFRLGQTRLGETTIGEASEQQRLKLRGDAYAADLNHLLESSDVRDSA